MENEKVLKCPKCTNVKMKRVPDGSSPSITLPIENGIAVSIQRYVCLKCGYIEEYAELPKKRDEEDPYEDSQLVWY